MKKTSLLLLIVFLGACSKLNLDSPPNFQRALILGNSILKHAPAPEIGWHGNWGMAASRKENDFFSILSNRLSSKYPGIQIQSKNIADFEAEYWSYDFAKFEEFSTYKADLLILRIGENVNSARFSEHDFKLAYGKLIEHFRTINPNIKIIAAGTFWNQEDKDLLMKSVAADKGISFVNLFDLSNFSKNMALGQFENTGVATHPSDEGMLQIADRLWSAIITL